MVLTDKEALKELNRIRSSELYNAIDNYPEDERDGRNDLQMLADEASYIISCFEECGHVLNDDLNGAKKIIKRTKNGKVIPLWSDSLTPVYRQSDIDIARDTINEYKRLIAGLKRLNKAGYFGKW